MLSFACKRGSLGRNRFGRRSLRVEPLGPRIVLAATPLTAEVLLLETEDFGDAPDSYGTLLASDGARHTVVSGFQLGASVDVESDGQPNLSATGDDNDAAGNDDDGIVTFGDMPRDVPQTQIEITIVNTAELENPYLDAWIDFDQNGSFDSPAELVASTAVSAGVFRFGFPVPQQALLGDTYARVRLHQAIEPGLPPTGQASSGEVEDYRLTIVEPTYPWHNQGNPSDVDTLDGVKFEDALHVVSLLRNSGNPTLLPVPRPPNSFESHYYDVDRDNKCTLGDALHIVSVLRAQRQLVESEPAELIVLGERDMRKATNNSALLDRAISEVGQERYMDLERDDHFQAVLQELATSEMLPAKG